MSNFPIYFLRVKRLSLNKIFAIAEHLLVVCIALVFRFNKQAYFRDFSIVWEGAYRISLGQIPYKDFGLPLGPASFLVPALFQKLINPSFTSLLISSLFLYILAFYAFRAFLKSVGFSVYLRFVNLFLFSFYFLILLKYPWYNTSAFVYEFCSVILLLFALKKEPSENKKIALFSILAGLLLLLSFMSKQDVGGIAGLLCSILLLTDMIFSKRIKIQLYFSLGFLLPLSAFLFLTDIHQFLYWFNYGQPPHSSRLPNLVNVYDKGQFYKPFCNILYISAGILTCFLCIQLRYFFFENKYFSIRNILSSLHKFGSRRFLNQFFPLLFLATLMLQGVLLPGVSGLGDHSCSYFVAAAFAFIAILISNTFKDFQLIKTLFLTTLVAGIFFWVYSNPLPGLIQLQTNMRHMVTDLSGNAVPGDLVQGKKLGYPSFGRFYLPRETFLGLNEVRQKYLEPSKNAPCPVLNMTELTPLAAEWGFSPCTQHPLWFDPYTSIFPKEISEIYTRIEKNYYGLILFQKTHEGNPHGMYSQFEEELDKNYKKVATIPAPRTEKPITVYIPKTTLL